jgi:hypothetical protein
VAFVVLIALPLAACFSEQKQQVAKCEFEAMKAYPGQQLETSKDFGRYMRKCMEAHGYNWTMIDGRCLPAFDTERNPYC